MPTLKVREFTTVSMYLAAIFGGVSHKDIATALAFLHWLVTRFFTVVEAGRDLLPRPAVREAIVVREAVVLYWQDVFAAPMAIPVGA